MAERKQTEKLRTEAIPLHRVLREIYRHYSEFRRFFSDTGKHVIEHSYIVYDEDRAPVSKETITVSLWDLQAGLKELSPRKREAFFYNVILDWKQREVADKMGITTVSVGQYVEAAMIQLAEHYFNDEELNVESIPVTLNLEEMMEIT